MRIVVTSIALLCALVAVAPAGAQAPPRCPGADDDVVRDSSRARVAVLCIVNAERAARALPPLAAEPRLEAAAQAHSRDMAVRGFFAHVTPEGRAPADRVSDAGYAWSFVSENIAAGQRTPRAVMLDWMQSEGHCEGVLAPQPLHLGVGLAPRRRPFWTQNFGLERDAPPPSQDLAPAEGCPYQRLSIEPGPAVVRLVALRRFGRSVGVAGLLEEEGAGRRIVLEVRRGGRRARRTVVTRAGGSFRATLLAPPGRGRVRVTATARAVPGLYKSGRATRRI